MTRDEWKARIRELLDSGIFEDRMKGQSLKAMMIDWETQTTPPASREALTDEQRDNFDVRIKEAAEQYASYDSLGNWIFRNHSLFKFVYSLLATAAQREG
jgi:hypothetical protein